ncbi:MAG: hypothetical protein LUQ71_07675 [Methanoregula sp.]|nr:hypothetical protein [Methanoregula sp.]
MRMTRMFAVLIAALCMLFVLPYAGAMSVQMDPISDAGTVSVSAASANDNYPISVEQAKNSVRLFMNDLTLEPTLGSTGSLEIGNYYNLNAGSDSFSVNQNTGVVEFVHFGANAPDSANVTLTRDQAYAKATEYAGQKYDGFTGKSWKLVVDNVYEQKSWRYNSTTRNYEEYVTKKAYDFVFREEKDHVLLPNLVYVQVNPVTGAIVDYWGVDRLVTAGLKNTVSLAEAVETTQDCYHFSDSFTLSSSEAYLAVVTRYQNVENLAWVVKLKGYYSWDRDDERTYYAVIDATDGSVLGTRWSDIWPESRLSDYFN